MGAPGVVGEKGKRQAEEYADDIDEWRCHTLQRGQPGRMARPVEDPLDAGNGGECAGWAMAALRVNRHPDIR